MHQYLYLIPLVTDFIKKQNETKKQLVELFRAEILAFALKIMIGLIISSLLIFMFLSIGKEVNRYILLQQNGSLILISVYRLMIVLAAVALTVIYKSKKVLSRPIENIEATNMEIDLMKIVLTFCEGVNEGLKAHREASTTNEQKHTNDPVADIKHAPKYYNFCNTD